MQDVAVQQIGLHHQSLDKQKHLYLISLKNSNKDRKFFLVNSNPSYESGLVDVKGFFVKSEKSVETINFTDEKILSVKFPLANINSIINLNYNAKGK